jgi:putative FmdB family regulatory protein
MPTYVYRCPDCEEEVEVVHGMHDDVEICCPECDSQMKRRPQRARVNWNGRKPSSGDWTPAQREIIQGAPQRRAETIPHKNTTIARLEREHARHTA